MTLQEIHRIAQLGEGLTVEFKKKAAFPDKIVKEIVALANTEGGHLLIGVDDDGTVSGQRYIEEEVFVMQKAIREHIYPEVSYDLHTVKLNPKKGVAVFFIKKSETKPHYLLDENKKRAFVRVADRSIQASREVWEILKRSNTPKDTIFTYGNKEMLLMKALENEGKITLSNFQKIAKLPKFMASKTLVKLVLANVIRIVPQENEDYFVLK